MEIVQGSYAEVILPLPLSQVYTYYIPEDLLGEVQVGSRVLVHFGARKYYTGVVYRLTTERPFVERVKPISALLDSEPIINSVQLKLLEFISSYYRCKMGEVYKAAIPSGLKLESETKIERVKELPEKVELDQAQMSFMDLLAENKSFTLKELDQLSGTKNSILMVRSLIEKACVQMKEYVADKYKVKTQTRIQLNASFENEEALHALLDSLKRAKKQLELVEFFIRKSKESTSLDVFTMVRSELLEESHSSASICKALENKGVFDSFEQTIDRLKDIGDGSQGLAELSEAQMSAFHSIKKHFQSKKTVLLHGVTSSGKTELYIHLIQEAIQTGKQALLLIPEIALTAQLAQRLRKIFGNKLAVYNSKYSDAERVEIWNHLLNGTQYQVVLGSRNAIFLPFQSLDLVIIDEEHDSSYKQFDPAPRFSGRDAAIMLAYLHGAHTLLGTATPSLETYYNAAEGKYAYVGLKERYGQKELPHIQLVDLSAAYQSRSMQGRFSPLLIKKMHEILDKKQQIILLQNKRGYASTTECHQCGWVPRCPNCDVTLTYHKAFNKMTCHYCGYTVPMYPQCPECGNDRLELFGYGTEELEQEVLKLFPDKHVKRMDYDTTRSKYAFEKIYNAFQDGEYDILIGTQMVAKGLDFDNVGLVGVIHADGLLNLPDFRAYERAFQLLQQVSGRAGRSAIRGEVIVQTSQPQHPLFQHLVHHDAFGFYQTQLQERSLFSYPPYFRLLKIVVKHADSKKLNASAKLLALRLTDTFGKRVLGPDIPIIGRIQNLYLKHLLLKVEVNASFERAKKIVDETILQLQRETKGLIVYMDVDPN